MKKLLSFPVLFFATLLLGLSGLLGFSNPLAAQQLDSLALVEDSLSASFNGIMSAMDDASRKQADEQLEAQVSRACHLPGFMDYPFTKLDHVAKVYSSDNLVRIFSWDVPFQDGSYKYHLFILHRKDVHAKPQISHWIQTSSLDDDGLLHRAITTGNWYGALYYSIIPLEQNNTKQYLLLGWDGANEKVNRKVMDVLSFKHKVPQMGTPIFITNGKPQFRVVLTYMNDVSEKMDWYPDQKAVIYPQLETVKEGMQNDPEFLAPGASFNGYFLEGKKLIYRESINFKPTKGSKREKFNKPKAPDFRRKRSKVNPLTGK